MWDVNKYMTSPQSDKILKKINPALRGWVSLMGLIMRMVLSELYLIQQIPV